jgi:membrane protease YdiL (CAAX protease family)
MKTLGRLATQHPVSFGLLVSLMVLVSYVVTALLAGVVAHDRAGYEFAEAIGRAVASLFFVYILWRLGWLQSSGVTKPGTCHAWLIMLVVLAYDLVTTMVALFGSLPTFGISDPALSTAAATNALMTGLIEEIPFRGLILYAFVRLWGDSRRGLIRAVLYSSLLFGGSHLVHILLGRPVPQAILVAVSTFLSGILYAAFVLRWRSVWTVVVLHGVVNALVAMRVLETPGFAETVPALALMIVLRLPLVVYGAYLIYSLPSQQVIPDAAIGRAQELIR